MNTALTAASLVKPSYPANDHLIDQTIALWRPRLGGDLDLEDARQIVENVTGFFSTIHEWSRAEIPAVENDNHDQRVVRGTSEACHDR